MIRKIPIDRLRPGMCVVTPRSGLWQVHPTLYTEAGVITSRQQVLELMAQGYRLAFVDVKSNGNRDPFAPKPVTIRGQVELTSELVQARAVYAEVAGVAHRFFAQAAKGRQLDVAPCFDAVDSISDSVSRNPDAMHCLARLSPLEDRLATHSVNVSVLCVVFGKYLGLGEGKVRELGLAGLLHDIGKSKVPQEILGKRGKLTAKEFAVVKKHSLQGLSLLCEREIPETVARGVAEHHERWDGNGYPMRLAAEGIGLFGRCIALADTFDAMTSKRPYQPGVLPSRALSVMYQQKGKQFGPEDVLKFIKCVGVYPTGSLVRLSDGRTGVVHEPNPKLPLSPIVSVVMDKRLRPIRPRVVNLAEEKDQGEVVKIASALCPREMGMDLGRVMAMTG